MAFTFSFPNGTTVYPGVPFVFGASGTHYTQNSVTYDAAIYASTYFGAEIALSGFWLYGNREVRTDGTATITVNTAYRGTSALTLAIHYHYDNANDEDRDTTENMGSFQLTFADLPVPSPPASITIPATINASTAFSVSWPKMTNANSYKLERQLNGATWSQVYSGTALSFSDTIAPANTNVTYRVSAIGTYGTSAARTSVTRNITRAAPTLSAGSTSLGTFTQSPPAAYAYTFTRPYTESRLTVTETLNIVPRSGSTSSQVLRTQANINAATYSNSVTITQAKWDSLPNGQHNFVIRADDTVTGLSTQRQVTFIKNVVTIMFHIGDPAKSLTPLPADDRPTMGIFSLNGTLPPEAAVLVEVCNNAFDASPYWQDITAYVFPTARKVMLTNTTKTATNWGIAARITVNRGSIPWATPIYITSFGGNYK